MHIPWYGEVDLTGSVISVHAVAMFHVMGVVQLPSTVCALDLSQSCIQNRKGFLWIYAGRLRSKETSTCTNPRDSLLGATGYKLRLRCLCSRFPRSTSISSVVVAILNARRRGLKMPRKCGGSLHAQEWSVSPVCLNPLLVFTTERRSAVEVASTTRSGSICVHKASK